MKQGWGLAQGPHSIKAVQKADGVLLSDSTEFMVPSADGTTAKGTDGGEKEDDERR